MSTHRTRVHILPRMPHQRGGVGCVRRGSVCDLLVRVFASFLQFHAVVVADEGVDRVVLVCGVGNDATPREEF